MIFTAQQFRRVNGFGTQYWGWGREDDNMRERLGLAGGWWYYRRQWMREEEREGREEDYMRERLVLAGGWW